MILIEGPRADIGAVMVKMLRDALHVYDMRHVNHEGTMFSKKQLFKLVRSDHRYEIHTGLITMGLDAYTKSMIGYALSTAGSVVVICGGNSLPVNVLPTVLVNDVADAPQAVQTVVQYWEHARAWMAKLWDYGSMYSVGPQLTMLVGDTPMTPFSGRGQALPFFGLQGQCVFLHEAMSRAGGKYYLTSAIKHGTQRESRNAIIDEVYLIKPVRIIALGSEASAFLARVDIENVVITNTYHPKYWQRFRASKIDELVDILRPTVFTNQNQ